MCRVGALTIQDVRYTVKGTTLYAFVMGWPQRETLIPALATNSPQQPDRVRNVELLDAGPVRFTQDETWLKIQLPESAPNEHAITFKINALGIGTT
jgi:alpha-L-fucosidase